MKELGVDWESVPAVGVAVEWNVEIVPCYVIFGRKGDAVMSTEEGEAFCDGVDFALEAARDTVGDGFDQIPRS